MKETNKANEFENSINVINQLSEDDAKSLLKIIYGFIDTAMTGNGGDQAKLETIERIFDIYKTIPNLYDLTNNSDAN